jgi:hypothetical protein
MTFSEMERLAERVAKSGLFGMRTADQALSLMSIAQAEGKHPALAARDYDIIQNRPAKRSEAMLRDFFTGGGRVQWHELTDEIADATFSHPVGGEARIRWDTARVKRAGLSGREGHVKYPRQMLRSRVVSEGVRTIWPMATGGLYVPEEIADMPHREPIDVTPPAAPVTAADLDAFAEGEVLSADIISDLQSHAGQIADSGTAAFRAFWTTLAPNLRDALRPDLEHYHGVALRADREEEQREADPFGLPPLGEAHQPEPGHLRVPNPESEAPAVPFAAAVRALVPVAGDDGELDWAAWSRAFVGLVEQATPAEARKCRLSDLPHYGRCRTEDGDAAAAVQAAVNAKSKEAPPP